MPTAHIFTVNSTTFNTHLNYMFAGTGADGKAEQKGALADILGIREGDNVLFYVAERGFYGFFKAVKSGDSIAFYEHNENQYLDAELNSKTLTYRLFIEPSDYGVYKRGVNEWDALENPVNIKGQSIYEMQWSWIFKKLKGGRGCTAIPDSEFNLLKEIIIKGNEKLKSSPGYGFSEGEIFVSDKKAYCGGTTTTPILSGDINKIPNEEDLRIFFSARAGKDEILNTILKPAEYGNINYISNEAKCSFGLRSMDLLFLTDQNKCLLIELKKRDVFNCNESIIGQMSGYARWISSYKPHLGEIVPILVIKEPRLYPQRRSGKYFKHHSLADYQNNTLSHEYRDAVEQIQKMKSMLQECEIDNLANLLVHQFRTNSDGVLQSFSEL